MKRLILFFGTIAAIPAAHGIAFGGSTPIATSPQRALGATSPKPTKGPSVIDLRKRQISSNPETCGWVDGDNVSGVTCSAGRTCMLYTSASVGMAGCCNSLDTQNCGWVKSCVDYSDYMAGNCGANCISNSFIRKCTNSASAYCLTWTYPSNGVVDYGCNAISGKVYTVLQSASNSLGGSKKSVMLTTLNGNAVTGFGATTSRTTNPTTSPSSNWGNSAGTGTKTKIAIKLIAGVAVAAIFVLFCIVVGIVVYMKKKKKQRQIAANAQIMAANHPPSQFPPPQQHMVQPTQPPPNQPPPTQPPQMHMQMQNQHQQPPFIPPNSPPPPMTSYFPPSTSKPNPHSQIYEYAQTPISNPETPAPAYVWPHHPDPQIPIPSSSPVSISSPVPTGHSIELPTAGSYPRPVGSYSQPVGGAHEVDAISSPHAPVGGGPVYELGQGGTR